MFFTHFVVSLIVSSFTVSVILLIRKVLKKQLSAQWQYNLWFLLLIALTLPFIPNEWFELGNSFTFEINQGNEKSYADTSSGDPASERGNWMKDFTVSVNRFDLTFLNEISASIWMIGMFIMTALTIRSWLMLKRIKSTSNWIKNNNVLDLFEQCKQRLNIRGDIVVRESPLIKSPLTFGLYKTYVVLPEQFEEWLSMDDIEYIFLHELNHYKYKDIVTNYLIAFYQILYWFNPFVWIAFKEMRLDREIACDIAVLNALNKNRHTAYGHTILKFVNKSSRPRYSTVANQLNDSKDQIKRRIEIIASFTTESKLLKLKSVVIFILFGVVVTGQVPIISAMAYDDHRYEFESERIKYDHLGKYFTGYEGTFVLYDLQTDQYSIYNENKSTLRVSPDSTYKIYSALFALESDVITNESSTMKWNGKQYPYDSWNMDQNLSTALENSVNWYFQGLDRKVGKDKIQDYLSQINYGNSDLSGGLSQYWLESSLKISPLEQVQLLKSFYTNDLGFKDKNVQMVKDSIKLEEKDDAVLFGKTGTGIVNGKNINGWFIGFVETNQTTYFFATNIESENNSYGSKAAKITKSILRDKGIY